MAHPPETRDALRRAYVFDRLSLEVAALKLGIPVGTATRWKRDARDNGDDWDKQRAAQLLAGGSIEDIARMALAGLVTQYQATIEALNTDSSLDAATKVQLLASLADAYNKTVSASKRVLPETSELATAMEVVQQLAGFIRQRYPRHGQAFAEILEPFGEEVSKRYG